METNSNLVRSNNELLNKNDISKSEKEDTESSETQNDNNDEALVKQTNEDYMISLGNMLKNDLDFYNMLSGEINFAYQKKEEHKDAAFSTKNTMLELFAEGITKITSAVLSLTAATAIYGFFVESSVNWKWKLIVGVVAIILLLMATYILGNNKINKKKESRETWVRFSLHYNRLMLLVKRFVIMDDESPKAIEKLKKAVFEQMEANLDKFEENMKE